MTIFAEMNLVPQSTINKKLISMRLHSYMLERFSLKYPDNNSQLSRLFKFIFLRHPFERLVSAFHDKFVTIKQLNIMEPFVNFYLTREAIQRPIYLTKQWLNKNINVTFKIFVDFVLQESAFQTKIRRPSWHWWPFSDLCKVCDIAYDYIGELESLQEDIDCMLEKFPNYWVFQGMTNLSIIVNSSHPPSIYKNGLVIHIGLLSIRLA